MVEHLALLLHRFHDEQYQPRELLVKILIRLGGGNSDADAPQLKDDEMKVEKLVLT